MRFNFRLAIDAWLGCPYIKGVVWRPKSVQPPPQEPIEEDPPNERTLNQPITICLLSTPSLETCDIFMMEPAFGSLPYGSHRTLLFHEPVAGLPGWHIRCAPCFFGYLKKPSQNFPSLYCQRIDP